MTYVVDEKCIKCKLMDCVEVCPVDCFYEGENMLVIHPDECIDCGACEPECPVDAIYDEDEIPEEYEPSIAKNYEFFGAPAAFFCFVDRQMGRPQWSDLGMFLQTFMLLAREAGLDTCPQEAWAMKQESVTAFVEAPDELMLFCGMAIGYQDESEKVNELRTTRRPVEDWAVFLNK